MTAPFPRFPGHSYDEDGAAITAEAPELTQHQLDTTAHRSVVLSDPDDEEPDAALVWVLDPAARYEGIPPDHVVMAVAAAQDGRAVVLLSGSPAAVESVGDGLSDLFDLIRCPGNGMARA